jgi:alkylation response protein AidB-like acyl-CoA dehydrogenase
MPLEAPASWPATLSERGWGSGPGRTRPARQEGHEPGLFGAPEDIGGSDLSALAMVGVEEELGRTFTPYTLPPDSPNLRMLMATVNDRQRVAYLEPYVRGETVSAIGISEPGAGGDPAGMTTHAERDGDDWVINGRKIWISRAADADFTILMALTNREKRARGGISAFLVDKGTPGFNVLRRIPMVGGAFTYEIALEDCRVEGWKLLGTEGNGFAPMQLRLSTRRIQMASWSVGISVERGVALSWALASMTATAAGVLWGSIQGVDQSLSLLLLMGITVAVLGGMDSLGGAILAGIGLGAFEAVASGVLDPMLGGGSRDLVVALVVILTIMIRPHGPFGRHPLE